MSGEWRFNNERVGRPLADKIYHQVYGKAIQIEDFRQTDHDRLVAIDIGIRFNSGQIIYAQEKFLSHDALTFDTLTIEYMQNPQTGEQGDWFKLGVHLYLAAYFNPKMTGFAKWVLIDWLRFVTLTANQPHLFVERQNKRDGARASFRAIQYKNIPLACVIAKS